MSISPPETFIRRFSSRTHRLDQHFLCQHLLGARSYQRIAGYFTSSLFEVANELLENIPQVQIVCNVDIDPNDLRVAQLREVKMLGRWSERSMAAEALLQRDRYRRLDAFLQKHGQAVRVAPDKVCGFVHGKAGVIQLADGRKLGFIGSMNETRSGWQHHYEILWEDDSPEGVAWIEQEFDYLWNAAHPLPQLVMQEVRRRGFRHEVSFDQVADPENLAPAALVESPLYREGLSLQPWQQSFIIECLRHYQQYQYVRLLLADEVGLGKTLSLGTAALTLCLLADKNNQACKPVVIFAPATLCQQWQTEMIDKLAIPCARWHSQRKVWLNPDECVISPAGAGQVAKCPLRIGIISTGLLLRDSDEKKSLLGVNFGLVILDEAHKARSRQGFGKDAGSANELLAFLCEVAQKSEHVLLGTATPMQTRPEDLWDLLRILTQGKGNFVLGDSYSLWHQPQRVLPILYGEQEILELESAWELLSRPLPWQEFASEPNAQKLFVRIRQDLKLFNGENHSNKGMEALEVDTREILEEELEREIQGASFFQRENPLVRHIVLRKRVSLEKAGLLTRVGVNVHPDRQLVTHPHDFDLLFENKALRTSESFRAAYAEAKLFAKELGKRGKGGGFMNNLLQQRICSSIQAGLDTAQMLLKGEEIPREADDEEEDDLQVDKEDHAALERLISCLQEIKSDPKLTALIYYLEQEKWREKGVIIFSQYYASAKWVAEQLAAKYPAEAIGLYAGADRSRLYHCGDSVSCERETLKKKVADHKICIMVATDAACEGLNLQTLGSLINVDLPWNPTRLEQRIGRIKRYGQKLAEVDMLNLVHEQTVDETIYNRLSERMQDRFDLFGSLPDTIKAEWIEDEHTLGLKMDEFIKAQKKATGFDLRYRDTMGPATKDWRDCSQVLSRRDFMDLMSKPWK